MPKVAICIENVSIPTHGVVIMFQGERPAYLPEYHIEHPFDCVPLLIRSLLGSIVVLNLNQQESDHHYTAHCGHLADHRRLICK